MPKLPPNSLPAPAFDDPKHHLRIYHGDCLELLALIPESSVDLVFADPPYFLSNGGITCHAGKMVSVNKGEWDKSRGPDANHEFNTAWLAAAQRVLKPNGSIWVSGTAHVIHSVGFAMQQLGFKLLNDISWVKPNPPPNLSCRYFTHATETIIWAAKNSKSRHTFHYKLMKEANRGKQMLSLASSFLLIPFSILWIDPIANLRGAAFVAAALGDHLRLARNAPRPQCQPSSNSSSKSAASISSAAPRGKSSSQSLPNPSTKPARNSAPPAAPTPTPSSSSKPKPKSTSPDWQSCYIGLRVPVHARISVVNEGTPQTSQQVRASYNRLRPLEKLRVEKRGWTLDVLQVVQSLGKLEFTLADVYAHTGALGKLHPNNAHVRDKIRQQLQVLRDLGLLTFLGSASYRLR